MPTEYSYGGARAMVEMHAAAMREFLAVWRRAKAADVTLPATSDPAYQSLEHLLAHVCRAGRGYMVWMCEVLRLPDPGIEPPPEVDHLAEHAEAWIEHLLARWDGPLAGLTEEQAYAPEYPSRWQTAYCIDAMLEHAVMHPQRHSHQLKRLMADESRGHSRL